MKKIKRSTIDDALIASDLGNYVNKDNKIEQGGFQYSNALQGINIQYDIPITHQLKSQNK